MTRQNFGDGEATRVLQAIDSRIDRKLKSGAKIEYTWAQVCGVSDNQMYASVYMPGETEFASDYFRIINGIIPAIDDTVMVAIDARGDRWVEQVYNYIAGIDNLGPRPDRALGSVATTVEAASSSGIIQLKVGAWQSPAISYTVSFDSTPTNGNELFAILFTTHSAGTDGDIDSPGWVKMTEGLASTSSDEVSIWRKAAGASEPTAVHVTAVSGSPTAHRMVIYEIDGSVDVYGSLSEQADTSPLTGPTIDPSGDPSVVLAAFIGQVASYAADPDWAPTNGFITDSFARQSGGRFVSWAGHKSLASGTTAPTLSTTTLYEGRTTGSAAIAALSSVIVPEWTLAAPDTVDGDDASYHEIEGSDILRLDLGAAFGIARMGLLIGSEFAGTVTYGLSGSLTSDYATLVPLGDVTFDSSGSFAPDDVEATWTTIVKYRYYQLTGPSETRRIYAIELNEPNISAGENHEHSDLDARLDALESADSGATAEYYKPVGANNPAIVTTDGLAVFVPLTTDDGDIVMVKIIP